MEARTLQAFLRVFYTVNSNPQYILAKSSSQVPAITCSDTAAQYAKNEPTYARTPLKACLAAVCESSPELLQDPARDFSLYVLDPLEALPLPTSLAHAPRDTGTPHGVAVALGLMSWALLSNDSTNVLVTGTIIPNTSPVLEVVFALRETKRMPRPILHSYPSLDSISAPGPSQPLNPPNPPQVTGMSWLSNFHLQRNQQEQRTLTHSADFPELYIGPPRRARGRPGSTSSRSKVTSQTSASSFSGASSPKVVETKEPIRGGRNASDEHGDGESDIVILDSSTIDTTAFRKPSNWQITASDHDTSHFTAIQGRSMPSSQDIHSLPRHVSTPPSMQENTQASSRTSTPTVAAEAVIPISEGLTQRRCVTALHALDMPATPTPSRTRKRKPGVYIHDQAHPSTPMLPSSPSPSVTLTSSSGSALTARQRVQSSPTGGTKSVSLPSVRLPSMLGSMRTIAASGSRLQSITLVSSQTKPRSDYVEITDVSLNDIASDATSGKRRRTLNEFMAEHEAHKSAKVRKRSFSGCKLEVGVSANAAQAAPPQSSKLLSTLRITQSSPSRPLCRSDAATCFPPASTFQPALVSHAAVANPALPTMIPPAHTTPSMTISTTASKKNPLKNFVLPVWARTSTAMLPRLSEEASARQRAEREAKKAQVSLRRREAAKAKRRRLCGAERPSKESSDEDEAVPNDTTPRPLPPSSSVARCAPLLPPPLPSLPVFASDAVEPIPSSPPQSRCELPPAVVPSTPPRKPTPSGSALQRTPSKSGSCSLFTPSGQDPGSLLTPSTPSVTRSLTQATFTPCSPTILHRPGARKSPRKSVPQTPWTPKRNSGNHQTPKSLCTGRNPQFMSPSMAIRTPQTQTRMGMRAFLLPPPSPCALRTPHLQKQMHHKVPGGSTPTVLGDPRIIKQESPSGKQNIEQDKSCKEENMLSYKTNDAHLEDISIPPAQCSPSRLTVNEGQGTGSSELRDITSNGDASQTEEEYASSPLPPSSPLPISPFSSPAKHHDNSFNTPFTNNFMVPDSDILLPSASDSDGPQTAADTTWHSDAACASWLTDSETSAWLTETETWLTDADRGPFLTDSDGAWLSDSDAVFGDMSSLPPSSASNWLSDDADVDTDGEFGAMEGRDDGFDAAAFERAFAALVDRGGQSIGRNEVGGGGAAYGTKVVESEFWESVQPLLAGTVSNEAAGTAPGDAGDRVNEDKVARDLQELLDGFVDT